MTSQTSELVGQAFLGLVIGCQGVGGASGVALCPHEVADQPFVVGMGGDQLGQLCDQLRVGTQP